jgi:hypothetical protein
MKYEVKSNRIGFKVGSVVDANDLAGCNIDALVQGGHLAPASITRNPEPPAPEPKTTKQRSPVVPVPNESADEPEEQD